MSKFKVGDRVMKADALKPFTIPAYRDMRGTIHEVSAVSGFVRVTWDCDNHVPESGFRHPDTLALDPDEPAPADSGRSSRRGR